MMHILMRVVFLSPQIGNCQCLEHSSLVWIIESMAGKTILQPKNSVNTSLVATQIMILMLLGGFTKKCIYRDGNIPIFKHQT